MTRVLSMVFAAGLVAGACGASHDQSHLVATRTTTATVRADAAHVHVGVLAGRLLMEGGTSDPATWGPRPIPGTVSFLQNGRVVASARAGSDGTFSATLKVGSYEVRACTPKIQMVDPNGSSVDTCMTVVGATVSANRTTVVDIPDAIVP